MNKRILIGILLLANGLATPSFSQETLHHWQSGAIKTPAAAKEETPANKEKEPLLFPTGDFAEMHQTDSPTVDQILDPYRLRLKDKRIVQLSGIEIPDFDINDSGAISIAAQNMLKELLEGKQVTLFQTRDVSQGRVNRLGHMLAHIIVGEEKTWVQGTLVANGMARVQ